MNDDNDDAPLTLEEALVALVALAVLALTLALLTGGGQ